MTKQYDLQQRPFVVKTYLETKPVRTTRILYAPHFGIKFRNSNEIPNKASVFRLTSSFKRHGSVEKKNSKSRSNLRGRIETVPERDHELL